MIVSSDSDYTRLATRLRESGMTVYGLGRRDTPEPFVAACDRFIYLDLLGAGANLARGATSKPRPELKRLLSAAISSTSKDDGWSNLAEVGSYLVKSHPDFDARDFGHPKLGELARAQPYVEVKDVGSPPGPSHCGSASRPDAGLRCGPGRGGLRVRLHARCHRHGIDRRRCRLHRCSHRRTAVRRPRSDCDRRVRRRHRGLGGGRMDRTGPPRCRAPLIAGTVVFVTPIGLLGAGVAGRSRRR